MISFDCDYNNGAHPQVLKHLADTNDEPTATYGYDIYRKGQNRKYGWDAEHPMPKSTS